MFKQIWVGMILFCSANVAFAESQIGWNDWLQSLRGEAITKGIRPEVVDEVFAQLKKPSPAVLKLDKTQPERRISFLQYRSSRADDYRIQMGRNLYKKYSATLNRISEQYGLSPCFILSFWGLETSYGNYMGQFPVIQSLATLAYDGRRGEFFRKQLFYALEMINDGHVTYEDLKGEWAGASGHPQFLPSSWHHYSVDQNKDGKRDIWKTKEDAFASIANYLIKHGWKPGEPWAIVVNLPDNFDPSLIEEKTRLTVQEWRDRGVTLFSRVSWPNKDLMARVIFPDGGPAMLAFHNFDVIMKWNHSTYYAGTVGYMAEKICERPLS
jgi:membrane-bound lytic murein transglycosylase B